MEDNDITMVEDRAPTPVEGEDIHPEAAAADNDEAELIMKANQSYLPDLLYTTGGKSERGRKRIDTMPCCDEAWSDSFYDVAFRQNVEHWVCSYLVLQDPDLAPWRYTEQVLTKDKLLSSGCLVDGFETHKRCSARCLYARSLQATWRVSKVQTAGSSVHAFSDAIKFYGRVGSDSLEGRCRDQPPLLQFALFQLYSHGSGDRENQHIATREQETSLYVYGQCEEGQTVGPDKDIR